MGKFWQDKRVIVTGANGFLGKHLVRLLKEVDCSPFIVSSAQYDLAIYNNAANVIHDAKGYFNSNNIDVIFHLAANVGGIGYNQTRPYDLFFDNAIMGINLIDASIGEEVKKFVMVGTTCSYPKHCPEPFHEENFWEGYPEETNAAYGLAKKMLLVQLQAAKQQYGFDSIYPVLTNLYGVGDDFSEEKSHVIPALIKKFVDAKDKKLPEVVLWGTGEVTRDFLYVEDAARALILAAEKYNECKPLNIGSGDYIRISALAKIISDMTGYEGDIIWDTNKPDGQPRRWLRSLDFWSELDWIPNCSLAQGLEKTIEWYRSTHDKS